MLLSFPLLTVQEIIIHLRDFFGFIYLKEENFTNPQGEIIRPILIKLLTSFDMSIEHDTFKIPDEERQNYQYPDLQDTFFQITRLYQVLSLLSKTVSFRGVGVNFKEIIFPDAKKVRAIISGLLNGIKFFNEFNTVEVANLEVYPKAKNSKLELEGRKKFFQNLKLEVEKLKNFIESETINIEDKEDVINEAEKEKANLLKEKERLSLIEEEIEIREKNLENEIAGYESSKNQVNEILMKNIELVVDPQAFLLSRNEKRYRLAEMKEGCNKEKLLFAKIKNQEDSYFSYYQYIKNFRNCLSSPELKLNEFINIESSYNASREKNVYHQKMIKDLEKVYSVKQHELDLNFKEIFMECNDIEPKTDRQKLEILRTEAEKIKLIEEITQLDAQITNIETKIKKSEMLVQEISKNNETNEKNSLDCLTVMNELHKTTFLWIKEEIQKFKLNQTVKYSKPA